MLIRANFFWWFFWESCEYKSRISRKKCCRSLFSAELYFCTIPMLYPFGRKPGMYNRGGGGHGTIKCLLAAPSNPIPTNLRPAAFVLFYWSPSSPIASQVAITVKVNGAGTLGELLDPAACDEKAHRSLAMLQAAISQNWAERTANDNPLQFFKCFCLLRHIWTHCGLELRKRLFTNTNPNLNPRGNTETAGLKNPIKTRKKC